MKAMPGGPRFAGSLHVAARAKVNLRLEVVRRRADGFHDVRTLMHTLALSDRLEIQVSTSALPGCSGPGGRPGPDVQVDCIPRLDLAGTANLAHRAASLYLQAAAARGLDVGADVVSILIRKQIPVAAGLGGGSADAAATLRALSALLGPRGGPAGAELISLARLLGSDVPFCLAGGAAWATGKGDELETVESTLSLPVLIAAPQAAVSSGAAYAWWDESAGDPGGSRFQQEETVSPKYMLQAGSIVPGLIRNDLRPAVAGRVPAVDELTAALRGSGALAGEMSGSGPAVYGVYRSLAGASMAAELLAARFTGTTWFLTRFDPRLDEIWGRD